MNILERVDKFDKKVLLQYKNKNKSNSRVPLILTYSRNLPNAQSIIHNGFSALHRSDKMKVVFPETLFTAFRRDANLQDIQIHSKQKNIQK